LIKTRGEIVMIEVIGVNKSYGSLNVLENVTLKIEEGDVFGIIGHSGAGKSTLLRCFNGLEGYDAGSIKVMDKEIGELDHQELRKLRKELGMIFQNFSLITRKNVFENIALPLEIWGEDKNKIKKRVDELLELVGLTDKAYSSVKKLSGGEKQRVGIARALALNPKILLCDEATSALDPKNTRSILALLADINKKLNITIVIVTHQMEVIKEICKNVVVLEGGAVKVNGGVEELFLRPTNELRKLMGEDELLPSTGKNIKLFFPKEISQECLITSIARELDIDFSIVWGKLEKFRDEVLGSLIINAAEENVDSILKYLDAKKVMWEVI
jgi:D-methionine transport system ATP-binding protein